MSIAICGAPAITAEQLAAFLTTSNPQPRINCTPLELAQLFISEGARLNIRGDIAFMQSIHETGWFKFGGQVLPDQNNYAGIGATNNSPVGKGAWFDTPQIGVRAQIQHLFAYATPKTTILQDECVDPRFNLVTRGVAPNWEDLNGRWAVPGPTYGQSIIALYQKCLTFIETLPKPEPEPEPNQPSDWAAEAWDWGIRKNITDGSYPQGPITREQVITILYRLFN